MFKTNSQTSWKLFQLLAHLPRENVMEQFARGVPLTNLKLHEIYLHEKTKLKYEIILNPKKAEISPQTQTQQIFDPKLNKRQSRCVSSFCFFSALPHFQPFSNIQFQITATIANFANMRKQKRSPGAQAAVRQTGLKVCFTQIPSSHCAWNSHEHSCSWLSRAFLLSP